MHLVVLQHGVWGTTANTKYLEELINRRLGPNGHVLNFNKNEMFATYDGIDVCGERLYEGIKSTHEELARQGKAPTLVSFVGYSMGGLIARYAAGRLMEDGYFDTVRPLNLITVATPHLGSGRPSTNMFDRLVNAAATVALSRTGRQLHLTDGGSPADPWVGPFMCLLTHPDLVFMAALRRFQNIVVLANVRHDWLVSFRSAAAELSDLPHTTNSAVLFDETVEVEDPAYPSIVRLAQRLANPAAATTASAAALPPPDPSPSPPAPALGPRPRRRLYGRGLFVLLIVAAVLLFPLVLLGLLLMLLHGWLYTQLSTAAHRPTAAAVMAAAMLAARGTSGGGASGAGGGQGAPRSCWEGGGAGCDAVGGGCDGDLGDVELGAVPVPGRAGGKGERAAGGGAGAGTVELTVRQQPADEQLQQGRQGSTTLPGLSSAATVTISEPGGDIESGLQPGAPQAAAPATGLGATPAASGAAAATVAGDKAVGAPGDRLPSAGPRRAGAPQSDQVPLVAAAEGRSHHPGAEREMNARERERRRQLVAAGLPADATTRDIQEWLAAQLGGLPLRRVLVDTCNAFHAHAAIIQWNASYRHCSDALDYLLERCMVWGA